MKKPNGLRQYMIIVFTAFGIILMSTIFPILQASVTNMEEELIASRLVADIHYIEDLIGDGDWNLKGDYICRGDVLVGDGTQEHANLEPFLLHEEKTGTFSYVFIRCGDEGLTYVESTPTQAGYQQGHFLRVAGSTKDPNGDSIVGTYMDKKVADILDAEDMYDGEANVAGGMIYCRYDTLKDVDGNVIGAIVVGRSISELKAQVNNTIRNVIVAGIAVILIGCLLLFLLINRWVDALSTATKFLQRIETGDIPKERLESEGLGEVDVLLQGINSLAETLQENEELRIKSETDDLTGLANRLGLNHFGTEIFAECIDKSEQISVGFLDIDYFKLYNDNYGHQMGDDCICRVANVLQNLTQDGKVFAARYGGDEFIVVTRGMDYNDVEHLAEQIRNNVISEAIPHGYSNASSVVTVSQGHYIDIPKQGQSVEDFLKIADTVMYEVKNGTKNGYRIMIGHQAEASQQDAESIGADSNPEIIEWSTHHDYLTQLLNREGFYNETAHILSENPHEDYYLVRTNIRNFKLVNQLFGYEKGNEILVETAEVFRNGRIENIIASRINGDHFAFLTTQDKFDEQAIKECVNDLSKLIENADYRLQYHVGVYPITDKSMDVSIMCDHANIAINAIGSDSESTISYYNKSMMDDILKENVIIAEFEHALATDQFKVFLQPLINRQGKLAGAEALVRWFREGDTNPVLPAEFIPTLEKAGLIYKLDLFVWEESAKILKRWKGTPNEHLSISVNVSPRDIIYVDIEQKFNDLIEKYDIDRNKLNLEFTETTLMSDSERYIKLVSSLHSRGFHVEIDDFGSGYSSLNMLKDIEADILKIDKEFLREMENQERSRSILVSIIEMSKDIDMTVIAEGVETESQLKFLTDIGCDLFQGFYYSKPIQLEEFEEKFCAHVEDLDAVEDNN